MLQIERISKDKLQQFIFRDDLQNREDISINEFSDLLYVRFGLTRDQAMKVARFIIEKPEFGATEVNFDPNLKLVNRKIVKII